MLKIKDGDGGEYARQKEEERWLNTGVRGAHTILPFQCEYCHIANIEGRAAIPGRDDLYLKLLRRYNLDMMKGRIDQTIIDHANEVKRTVKECAMLNKTSSLPPIGPMPLEDTCGASRAVEMLFRSITARGKTSVGHILFSSLRKMRATTTLAYESSPGGMAEMTSFSSGVNKVKLTTCPTQSEPFRLFLKGCERRMGHDSLAQRSLRNKAIVRMLDMIKADASIALSRERANELYRCGAAIAVGLMGSLRGPEIWMLDLAGIRKHIEKGKRGVIPFKPLAPGTDLSDAPHVCIVLVGRLKRTPQPKTYIMSLASTSRSGVELRWWLEKLIEIRESEGATSGFAFAAQGKQDVDPHVMNSIFVHYVQQVQQEPPAVNSSPLVPEDDDVLKFYGFDRSLRRSAETAAKAAGLGDDVENTMNRWRVKEKADRHNSAEKHGSMSQHYADARDLMPVTWRYSYVQ